MLLSLHIENIAVIKSVDFDFSSGFTVLSGETGAGKSIVLDAISLLLGAKAERELIRTGSTYASVSGLFGGISEETSAMLRELGVPVSEDGTLLCVRYFTDDGKSKVTLNGRSVSLSVLKSVTRGLVSIHGQSDTASLVESKKHLELIDVYADTASLLARYELKFDELEQIRSKIREITERAQESERLKEILEYQINDIDSVSPRVGEEEELSARKVKIKNSEKILKNSEFVFKALKGSEKGSVSYLLDRSATALSQLSGVVEGYSDYSERLREVLYQIDDIAEEVYAVVADMESDSDESLNEIESRLDKLSKLKRKYGLTVEAVLQFRDKAASELDSIVNSDGILKALYTKEAEAYREAIALADSIHEARCSVIGELETRVKETLEFLDMQGVVFFVSVKDSYDEGRKVLMRDGYDQIEFYISANRGAEPQPLSKIASGGELSRIMLALKSVIADKDGTETIIYDEIDTGVSGKTARKIGIKMLELSRGTQIFSVTHSAQIASLADVHYLISKGDVNGVTETSVTALDYDGRVRELSRILGGIAVTESQREAARDMLNERDSYLK